MKTAKKFSAVILASIVLGCATPKDAKLPDNHMTATNLTGIVYNLTKEEGLQQLNRLVFESKHEDLWYFIQETEEWLDYGKEVARDCCIPDSTVLLSLRPDIKEVSSYHIHTLKSLQMSGFYRDELKEFFGVLPPSVDDVKHWLEDKSLLKRSGIILKESGVVDCGGYWQVDLETTDLNKLGNSLEDYEYLVDYHVTKYYQTYRENKNDSKDFKSARKSMIESFEQKASELGLRIKYNFF